MNATLGLGTVQFGLPYGVSNRNGKPDEAEVQRILAAAAAAGVRVLDTAPSYGDSEAVLGRALPPSHSFRIVTKTAAAETNAADIAAAVSRSVRQSRDRLRCDRIDGLLVHHAGEILGERGPALIDALLAEKASGRVRAIGVSVYDAEQIDRLLDLFVPDIVQLPISALDQRLVHSGHIAALADAGVELHARSVFLQGVMLMEPGAVPDRLSEIRPFLEDFRHAARAANLSPLAAALGFVATLPQISVVLCGITSTGELQQLCEAWSGARAVSFAPRNPPPAILDPRAWNRA